MFTWSDYADLGRQLKNRRKSAGKNTLIFDRTFNTPPIKRKLYAFSYFSDLLQRIGFGAV